MLCLFKEDRDNTLMVKCPIKGKIIDITAVPDAVFSQKLLGDGVAIQPIEGRVVAPFEGEVLYIMDTNHAIAIKSKNGIEILIHVGIDTVEMKGEGFEIHVAEGDRIMEGMLLITFDLNKVAEKAKSTITPIVITNMDEIKELVKSDGQQDEWIMKAIIEG